MPACVAYVRVSTERQAGEAQTSPADQRAGIERLAAKLKVAVTHWFEDLGKSGATVEKRPQFRALLAYCEANPQKPATPGYVLVFNDSRWGRFPDPDQAAALRYRFSESGWIVRLVEGDDVEDVNYRHIIRAIGGVQASQHRQAIRGNAKRGSRGTAAQGFWGSRTPYGYRRRVVYPPGRERVLDTAQRKAADEKVILTPYEPEAVVVQELFARYATGTESLSSVTIWLRERAPERKWTRPAVRFTLANPAYVGDVVSGRVPGDRTERAITPTRPESEWVLHPDAHPPLVSRTTFVTVQDMLARNRRWTRRVRTTWLLSGLVRCPCGRPLVAGGGGRVQASGERAYSYRCVTKTGVATDRCPYACSVLKSYLEDAVIRTLARYVGSKATRSRLLDHLDRALADVRAAPDAAGLDASIRETTATRDRLVAAVADGTLTGEEAKSRLAQVRRQLARLEAQREAVQQDRTRGPSLDAERAAVAALVTDFPASVRLLAGPELRETIRPWIAGGWFDPTARVLTLDLRHIPAFGQGVLTSMACRPNQKTDGVTRKRVVVGGRR